MLVAISITTKMENGFSRRTKPHFLKVGCVILLTAINSLALTLTWTPGYIESWPNDNLPILAYEEVQMSTNLIDWNHLTFTTNNPSVTFISSYPTLFLRVVDVWTNL